VFKKFPRILAWAAAAVPAFLLLAAGDLALRSRSALLEAGRQERWRDAPALKAAYFDASRRKALAALDAGTAAGRITAESAARSKVLLNAERDFRVSESSAKMAYVWYKSAAGEFSFPLNPWAKKAREKLPGALAAWRGELAARWIKAEPWMTE
jgi:hypothetical protein